MTRAAAKRSLTAFAGCFVLVQTAAAQPLNVPFFAQKKDGCGAASVAMLMHYWAKQPAEAPVVAPSPEHIYERLYSPERRGILLLDMKRFLEESGYRAFTLRGQWTDIEQHLAKGRPIIVALAKHRSKGMHFAVVVGARSNNVWLNDPTRKSLKRLKHADFNKQWNSADRWMLLATPQNPQ
jgi:predicted double-glycine peptidase